MKRKTLLSSALMGLLLACPLQAAPVLPLPIAELTEHAQVIVQGTVLSKTCQQDATGRIITKIELSVADVWKGNISGSRFTIVQGGGTLGNRQTRVSGQAEYKIGEEVVAFVLLNERQEGVTLGLAQGKFLVWKDEATGKKMVSNPFPVSAGAAAQLQSSQSTSSREDVLPLSALKTRVQGGQQ